MGDNSGDRESRWIIRVFIAPHMPAAVHEARGAYSFTELSAWLNVLPIENRLVNPSARKREVSSEAMRIYVASWSLVRS
jgi:hypothetical protein